MADTKLAEAATSSFARHETFAPRFGWLRKGFVGVNEDPDIFLKEDAPVILGVGKNMVSAIRYWSTAFKLTVEYAKNSNTRAHSAAPTWEALWLLGEYGADPYLEDPASLWLLHWWLLTPTSYAPCYAPTWWVAFNTLPSARFSEAELAEQVGRHIRMAGWEQPAVASIAKDVDCLTKMYAPRKTHRSGSPGSFEDLLDCPFRELGILEGAPGGAHLWRFTSTAHASLPARIVAYACLDYVAHQAAITGSVTLARLANEPGAPGRVFRLREPEIASALEQASANHPAISVTEAAGSRSLVWQGSPPDLAWKILDAHYNQASLLVATRQEWESHHPELAAELRRRAHQADRLIFELGGAA